MRWIMTSLTALLATGLMASDDKPLPKDLPPYGADRPIPKPEVQIHALPNGLTVWLVPRPGLPKLTYVLGVKGGTASEAKESRGLLSIMASQLKEGTKTRSSKQIAETAQSLGGNLGAGTDDDGLMVRASALSVHGKSMLDLMADVVLNPIFPEKELELAKANTIQGLKAQEAQPEFQAEKAFAAAIFGEHPYSHIAPDPKMIAGIQRPQIEKAYQNSLRPDRAILVVSGDFKAEGLLKDIQKAFGGWKASGEPRPAVSAAPERAARRIILVDRPDSVQSQIKLGRPTLGIGHADRYAMQLVDSILGGGLESRITKNIREDKGYTYSPGTSANFYLAGGSFSAEAAVRNEVTGAAVMELLYEFDRLAATETKETELASHKRLQVGIYLLRNQLQGAVASMLAGNWILGQGADSVAEFVPKMQAVTTADIRRVAQSYLASKDQTIVVVGDAKQVKSQLEQFGKVE